MMEKLCSFIPGEHGRGPGDTTRAGRGSISTYSGASLIESFLCLQLAPKETVEPAKDLTECPGVLCGVEGSVGVGGWYEIVE